RFLFGIGGGWNQEEIENHGTAFATRMRKMREQIEAMKAIWTESKPEYHGDIVNFDTMSTWPTPVRSRTRPSFSAAPFRGRRGARCATATAGIRTPPAATRRNTCRPSARWRRRRDATRNRC